MSNAKVRHRRRRRAERRQAIEDELQARAWDDEDYAEQNRPWDEGMMLYGRGNYEG